MQLLFCNHKKGNSYKSLLRADESGASKEEITDVIETGFDIPAIIEKEKQRYMNSKKKGLENIMNRKRLKFIT